MGAYRLSPTHSYLSLVGVFLRRILRRPLDRQRLAGGPFLIADLTINVTKRETICGKASGRAVCRASVYHITALARSYFTSKRRHNASHRALPPPAHNACVRHASANGCPDRASS